MGLFKTLLLTLVGILTLQVYSFSATALGVPFVENKGQIKDKNVVFHAKTFGGGFFILKDGTIVHSLSNNKLEINNTTTIFESLNNTKKPKFVSSDKSNLKVNFFYGDKKDWITNLNSYKVINYGNIYDGVDLKLLSRDNNVEKLFVVEPFGDPKKIDITLKGIKNLKTSFDGRLIGTTKLGDISFTKPVAWTEDGEDVKFVEVGYKINKKGYSFQLGDYDKSKTLVIDPLLGSTFIGGSTADEILDLDVNTSTNRVYVAGHTLSSFHTNISSSAGLPYTSNKDGFIAMLNEDLNQSSYMTYIGGTGNDEIKAIDINPIDGSIYVTGITESSNFPTSALGNDTTYNGNVDSFISAFNPSLTTMNYSTYLGGGSIDILSDIKVDSSGYVFVTGYSTSSESSLPVVSGEGNDSTQNGNYDSITFKLSQDLKTIINSTFLGTTGSDGSQTIGINNGNVYVGGFTSSSTFPLSNTTGNGVEGFLVQFDMNLTDGNSSVISGNGDDEVYGLDFNYSGGVVVAGTTNSTNLSGAGTIGGNKDGFIATFPFDLSGGSSQISYLGGSNNDEIRAIEINRDTNTTFVTGYTTSTDFNTTNSIYQTSNNGNGDLFVSKYKNGIKDLNASTFIGGAQLDLAHTIKIGNGGNLFIGGVTSSSDFPISNITGSILATYSSDTDGFILKIDENLTNDFSIIETSGTSTNIDLTTDSQYFHLKNVILGEESDEIVGTITNSGTATLSISGMDLNNTSLGFNIKYRGADSNPCNTSAPFTLMARKSCTFGVTFTPSSLNEANATLTINNDSNRTEHNITLSAIGVLAGVQNIYVTPSIIDFQSIKTIGINTYLDGNITIVNRGNTNLIISDINSSDGNFSIRTTDAGLTCGNTTPTINGDQNCTFAVRFLPTSIGDFNQTISIKSNDPDTPITTVKVNGRSVSGISASPTSYNYGNVITTGNKDYNITITNSGVADISVTAIGVHTGTSYSVPSRFGDCSALPATLSTNEECNITVRFSPATNSVLNDTLKITSNDLSYPEFNISLSGTGVSPSSGYIETNVTVKNFGTSNLGVANDYNDIKISNSGLADVAVTGFNLNGSTVFTVDTTKGSNPCNSSTPTIASGSYCTFGITFTPASSVSYEDNLTITSNASNGDLNISLVGTGVLNNATGLTLSSFNASSTYGLSPLTTDFNVSVTGGSGTYSYLWDFNDTTTSTNQNVTKTYTTIGQYTPSVKVSDLANPNNYIVIETNVSVVAQINFSPVSISSFSISPSAGSVPFATTFSLTPAGGSGTYTYQWQFGDGEVSTLQNPTHTYSTAGTYNVSVVVTDSTDTTNTTTGTASVVGLDSGGLSIAITGTPTSGTPPFDVDFSGTVSGGSIPYTLSWNFGDGESSTQVIYTANFTKSHKYTKSGSFETSLVVSDSSSSGTTNARIYSTLGITSNKPITAKSVSSPTGGEGDYCFIATAAYGSLLEPEVKVLRAFRDEYLRPYSGGRWFIKTYYNYSPPIANYISKNEYLKFGIRAILTPIIYGIKYKVEATILILLSLIFIFIGRIREIKYNPKEIFKTKVA